MSKNKKKKAAEKGKNETAGGFFAGVKRELSKVVWPTKKELVAFTIVVLVFCAVFALGFYLIDIGFLAILKPVLG